MNIIRLFLLLVFSASFSWTAGAQVQKQSAVRSDKFDFNSGGTVTITGAPSGSMRIVGTPKNEIEISATVVIEASNEADLAKLDQLVGFATNESPIHVTIDSIGAHNKFGQKKLPKDFPKHLLTVPYRIDYVISVPRFTDLEIDGGKGDLSITGVEGSMRVNYIETKGYIEVVTGTTLITVTNGSLDVAFGARGWRGRAASVGLGSGSLIVRLPSNLSAELDANIIKTGAIENTITDLKPRDRKVPFTDRSIAAKAGVGGAPLKFAVADGTLKLERLVQPL